MSDLQELISEALAHPEYLAPIAILVLVLVTLDAKRRRRRREQTGTPVEEARTYYDPTRRS